MFTPPSHHLGTLTVAISLQWSVFARVAAKCLPCSDDERDVLVEEVAESISDISVWTATLTFPIVVWVLEFSPGRPRREKLSSTPE